MDERGTVYEKPEVRNYGDFRELTAWKGDCGPEDGSSKNIDMCSTEM